MDESRKKLLRRRNIVGTSGANPPFNQEKYRPVPPHYESSHPKEINISLSGDQQDASKFQNTNQHCQTTINLFINDPHMLQKNWEKYRRTPPRRRMRNEIVLGKNIPDHTLMKNLLGDLGVKKYSSAPEMTHKYLNVRKKVLTSERSFTDSSEDFPEIRRNYGMASGLEEGATFLYVNEGRCRGDFASRKNVEKINEEEEEREAVEEETKNCPVHDCVNSVVKVPNDHNVKEGEELRGNLKDPLKRFRRKPFRVSQLSKNPAILYRDITASKPTRNEVLEQPRRITPSFNVRTQMVRDILNTNPELLNSYQSGLMRNHKRLFDSLRHKNFQIVLEETSLVEEKESTQIRTERKIDQVAIRQSKLIFSGKNRKPICSVESHGTYEEYRKNLVEGPDGTLCCKNISRTDDEVWTRAETRRIITSELVKDKVRKFNKLLGKKTGTQEVHGGLQRSSKNEETSKDQDPTINNPSRGTLSHDLLNGEAVSFPRETKNAMTRLMSKNFRMLVDGENRSRNNERRIFGTLKEMRSLPIKKRDSVDSSTSCLDGVKFDGSNNKYRPGVAERVRSAAEENTP